MATPRYAFLDTWVFSLLRDAETDRKLTEFLRSGGYTVVVTSLSLVELFNPGWEGATGSDRVARAAHFLARVPCVIVNPAKVFEAEIAGNLSPLEMLPVELDLESIPATTRESVLLMFLRGSDLFVSQGLDIHSWSDNYAWMKRDWLDDIDRIIQSGCHNGYLKRDRHGRFIELASHKELFLFSLDLRLSDHSNAEQILAEASRRRAAGQTPRLTAVRLSSLCFWYSYVETDAASRTRRSGSDIGDFFQLSLLPYCAVFTVDSTMHRILHRIRERVTPVECMVMSKPLLEAELAKI